MQPLCIFRTNNPIVAHRRSRGVALMWILEEADRTFQTSADEERRRSTENKKKKSQKRWSEFVRIERRV